MKTKIMESKLIYVSDKEYYNLEDDKGNLIATSSPLKDSSIYELSLKNCIEVSGNINIIGLAESWYFSDPKNVLGVNLKVIEGFKAGFNKAMELNKDKLFTVEDIRKAYATGYGRSSAEIKGGVQPFLAEQELIQSLQQPTEIDVEIRCYVDYPNDELDSFNSPLITSTGVPKLDENGCLILKRK
jgi:hypothetical protein